MDYLKKPHSNSVLRLVGVSFLLAVFAIASCSDVVNKTPLVEQTSENFFQNEQHAIQATNASYQKMRDWNVHVFSFIGLTDMISDDATKGSTPTDAAQLLELENLTFDAGSGDVSAWWEGNYQGIYRTNIAIKNIPGIDMNTVLRDRLVAENRFLRAYYYFNLVRGYGGVPLITEPLSPDEYEQDRASAEEIYSQIISDLEAAADDLPVKSDYPASDLGRATKGAADALLSRVYLFRENYELALQYAEDVITSNEYQLLPDYFQIFTNEGENSSESIFEVQATDSEEGGTGSQYAEVQGVRGQPNLGWGFNRPSRDLDAAYENGDLRQQATILSPWEELPDGSGLTVVENTTMVDERYNKKAFAPSDHAGARGNSPVNIRRIRYADVLLIAAEASYRTGNEGDARTYLNMVRDRARVGNTNTMGVIPENMAPLVINSLDLEGINSRVFARFVNSGSPADVAGAEPFAYSFSRGRPVVEVMDLFTSINGTEVTNRTEFLDALNAQTSGSTIPVEIIRIQHTDNGQVNEEITLNVAVEELLPDVTASGQSLLDAIWHERRVELAMEQKRWFDLIRQGRAADVMQALGKNFETGKHELFPIPTNEIDLSNGRLQQNPNW
ncbi:RagB/SusD family nutrient uptake outer membrane protein [Rhodohalobacter sp. SW132]|uniref:RagB/SusD family nutrient uptake outer membrane protein n=1 Tax=Rhodohalobacter sp. SW132 TaxID=2293433 RepID=UPI000E2542FD|nr:RagB/SusD family nutrient uptake outer membrane protein [Rhodohalobacter sp. SW132]REL38981.1 RagB/SusD family nutrient uptake outer membrane protein [Rhodohalobacter sp. SW132]